MFCSVRTKGWGLMDHIKSIRNDYIIKSVTNQKQDAHVSRGMLHIAAFGYVQASYGIDACVFTWWISTKPSIWCRQGITLQCLYSLRGGTFYCTISSSLESARFAFKLFQPLQNLTCTRKLRCRDVGQILERNDRCKIQYRGSRHREILG